MASYEKRTWWSRLGMTERLADEAFLEASIACAFLVAAADGSQSEAEYDALLDRLEILGGIDRDKIDEMLTAVSNQVEASEQGADECITRVAELVKNKESAEAALMLGLAIALADDDFSQDEREVATKIATGVGLTGTDVDRLLGELRG